MNLLPENLENSGYLLKERLDHQEIIPFVREYLSKKTMISKAYNGFNILFALVLIALFVLDYRANAQNASDGLLHMSYGMGIAFLLIPIHEYIHALAYRYVGAKETSYDANLKKFYFMAMADKFVANRKEFTVVALAPFVTISAIGMLAMPFANDLWQYTIAGMLLTHAAFCSGDFGLLCYFEFHKNMDIVTYDDKANKLSYFYEKNIPIKSI